MERSEPNVDFKLVGHLKGHSDWVTQIATSQQNADLLVSSSRDKSLIVWRLDRDAMPDSEGGNLDVFGKPEKALTGHGHFVSDVVLSSDGAYALSGSWDSTMRLWDLNAGKTKRRFVSHKKDVLSVAISADNRQIVSGSRDNSIKLWNTLAECKFTISSSTEGEHPTPNAHSDWVSCVRFSPNPEKPIIVSCGWDKVVKVWDLTSCASVADHVGHSNFLTTVTVSPDGSLCASGGKDGNVMLWDLDNSKHLYTFSNNDAAVNALCFSPTRYWLCGAVGSSIKIYDLKRKEVVKDIKFDVIRNSKGKTKQPECLCLTWSLDGQVLFAGFSDNTIRAWQVDERN